MLVCVAVVVVVEETVVVVAKERVDVMVVLAGAAAEVEVSVVVTVDYERHQMFFVFVCSTHHEKEGLLKLTVMVLVAGGRVVVADFVAVYVLVLVVFATTRAPQVTF